MRNSTKIVLFFLAIVLISLACSLGNDDDDDSYRTYNFSGFVWIDKNGNGIYDEGEDPASGVEVALVSGNDTKLASTTTGADGKYSMSYLSYDYETAQIMFGVSEGWSFTAKDAGSEGMIDSDVFNIGKDVGKTSQLSMASLNGMNAGIIEPIPEAKEPPTPQPQETPTETTYLFSPSVFWFIEHGSGISFIFIEVTVHDQDNNLPENTSATGTLTLLNGDEVSQTVDVNPSGIAPFSFEINQYGDYPFQIDEIANHTKYRPELNFATMWTIPVDSQQGQPYFPPGAVGEFYEGFNAAFQQGDTQFLFDRLHPAVIEQYGPEPCQDYLDRVIDKPVEVFLIGVTDFGPWNWEVGSQEVPVENAFTASVEITLPDGSYNSQFTHLALNPETQQVSWFTYCDQPDSD